MTFSGLPSLRDPKQSYKNSASSASSATSSSSDSSSTASSPVKTAPTEQQQLPNEPSERDAPPTLVSSSDMGHASGPASASSGETMSTSMIETSFQDLVQAHYHSTLDSKIGAVPSGLDLRQPAAAPKKKASAPHNLSPAHSAAYRKRLNVNQVCDWCRYRKIRCDRESPCNSCQHSKRECIRTPPSVLLSNQNKDKGSDADQPDSTAKTKRSRMDDDKDPQSRRVSKSYRGSSTSSHPSSSYTSYSSGDDDDGFAGDDDRLSVASSRTHASQPLSVPATALTLAELGLAELGGLGSGSPLHLLGGLDAANSGSDPQQLAASSSFSSPSLTSQGNPQDQEHLERMRRIELLLCSVIPGASEFIAHGTQNSLVPQQQQAQQQLSEQKGLSLNLQGLRHQSRQKRDVILSPQELLSRISLASPGAGPAAPSWARNLTGLREEGVLPSDASSHEQEQHQNQPPSQQSVSPSVASDYVQRMERIEILLRTVQKLPQTQAMFSEAQQEHPDAQQDLSASRKKQQQKNSKKQGKAETRKHKSGNLINSNGAVVKRPHVAAGFAGQKPPPKLPQAIAEAARKRQATRKKRVTAAAARAAATVNAAAVAAVHTNTMDLNEDGASYRGSAMDNTAALPSTVQDHARRTSAAPLTAPPVPMNAASFSQGQELQQQALRLQQQQYQRQHQQQMETLGHSHRQPSTAAFNMYQQHQQSQHRLPVATINSMAIPMASSYGSLVVPASSSTCSSATSSPRTERAEALSVAGTEQDDMGMSPTSEDSSVRARSTDQMLFSEAQFSYQQQSSGQDLHSMPYSQVQASPAIGMGMGFDLVGQAGIHQFSDQYVPRSHQPLQTSQANNIPDFGLHMGESLESLMKKNMGSLDGLLSDLSGGAPLGSTDTTATTSSSLSMPMQSLLQAPSTPTFEHGVYDPSGTAVQFNYFQQQRDVQQRQVQPVQHSHQDTLKSLWMPSHSGSFAVPANTEFSWPQQHQQHQTTPSINISANDSPQSEVGPELDLDRDQIGDAPEQQQQPLSAHALFQQQHEQQQQQQQQEQLRKNSMVLDNLQPQQHRASGQHQHQHLQSFYIPQMQDEDDDGVFQAMYDSTKSSASEGIWDEDASVMTNASSSIHSSNPKA
ncbi:hypothetical protein BGZ72_006613 [Mortierella alpina]|nr:hypothetical protein BGZ72_006613 [Mortierella alpina]